MSYARRRIDIAFRIQGPNTIPGASGNTLVARGLRVQATISKPDATPPVAELRIYGLTLAAMNGLSTIGLPPQVYTGNTVAIMAGDDRGTSQVFSGHIMEAYAELNEAPDSTFVVRAQTGLMQRMAPVPPTSFNGSVDVATVMAQLASIAGYTFWNNGVQGVMLDSCYLRGTAQEQIEAVRAHADISANVDGNKLTIWPKTGSSTPPSQVVPRIAADTGMIGYPRFNAGMVSVDMEFNPSITQGGTIQVESVIKPASGQWIVLGLQHHIESETLDGAWLTHADCYNAKFYQGVLNGQRQASGERSDA